MRGKSVVRHCRVSLNYYMFLAEAVVLLLCPNLPRGYGDNVVFGTCSAQSNTTCAAQNRSCVKTITGGGTGNGGTEEEKCDSCLDDYVPALKDNTNCHHIEELDVHEYQNKFQPDFFDPHKAPAERDVLLKNTAKEISAHNAQFPPPKFLLGFNELSAFSPAELKRRNGSRPPVNKTDFPFLKTLSTSAIQRDNFGRALSTLPKSINWVQRGAVTSVKNQGNCGCCWSISAVGAVEGKVAIDTNMTFEESLSFQQLISCDTSNSGCDGGLITSALEYIDNNRFGGVTSYKEYPFTDSKGQTSASCKLTQKQLAVAISSPISVTTFSLPSTYSQRIQNMKIALATGGPVSVLMSADCSVLYNYASGVIDYDGDCACTSMSCLNHGVLMVGYDDTAQTPYFLVKNSWGSDWGESGYFRVAQSAPYGSIYGLFGLLAQGTLPSQAANRTAQIASDAISTLDYNWAGMVISGTMVLLALAL